MKNSQKTTPKNHLKLSCVIILCFLMVNLMGISLISAMQIDNRVYEINKESHYPRIEIENLFGFGEKLASLELNEEKHTFNCGEHCYSEVGIEICEDSILVEDIIFETVLGSGNRIEQEIRSFNVLIQISRTSYEKDDYELQCSERYNPQNNSYYNSCKNIKIGSHTEYIPKWEKYNIGTEVIGERYEDGSCKEYNIRIEGEKKPSRTSDWKIKTQGKLINALAVWQGSSFIAYDLFNKGVESPLNQSIWVNTTQDGGKSTLEKAAGYLELFANNDLSQVNSTAFMNVSEFEDRLINISFGSRISGSGNARINVFGTDILSKAIPVSESHWWDLIKNGSNIDVYNFSVFVMQITPTNNVFLFEKSGAGSGQLDNIFNLTYYQVQGLVKLNSPENNFISPTSNVELNATGVIVGGATLVNTTTILYNFDGSINQTNVTTGLSGTTNTSVHTLVLVGGVIYNWTREYCDSDGDCGISSENRTISFDSSSPNITINLPTTFLGYGVTGGNEILNWTIVEDNLDSIWFEYNEINTTLFGASNETEFILQQSPFNLTVYANDSLGNMDSAFTNWSYIIFQTNQSFDNSTFGGAEETFTLDFILNPSSSLTDAIMTYNNTNYTSSIISIGDQIRLSNTINVPIVNEATNFSFNFTIIANGQSFVSENSVQLVGQINMTNCTDGGTVILNMSLFDEKLKTNITGDIEINTQAIAKSSLENAGSVNLLFNGTHNALVCISTEGVLEDLYLDAEIRYSSENYVTELYYIQRADLANYPINLSLFNLLSNQSTEFLITYQDDDLILVEGAIIQLQRKYISEDIYEVVEAPLTSNGGTAVVHVDLDNNKYKATVVKNGEVLDFFDNLVFHCESELSGQCTQELLGLIDPQNDVSIETLTDFSYSVSQVNDTITTTFSIPSGTPSSVNIFLNQIDQFNNSFPCNNTVFSSAGSVDCEITPTIGDSFLELTIKKADELQAQKSYVAQEDPALSFLGNNYFILFILMLSVVGMAFTSPEWIVINGVITMVIAGALYLANGLNFVVGLGNLIWLVIAAVIIIFKLSHQEDR